MGVPVDFTLGRELKDVVGSEDETELGIGVGTRCVDVDGGDVDGGGIGITDAFCIVGYIKGLDEGSNVGLLWKDVGNEIEGTARDG